MSTNEKNLLANLPQTDDNSNESDMLLSAGRFDNFDLLADLSADTGSYCSMIAADNRDKVTLYNACNQSAKLSEMINKQITIRHIYIEIIPIISKVTGAIERAPSIVLIDKSGKGYRAVSLGIYNAVKQMLKMFGDPANWPAPHTVEVVNVPLEGGYHTFSLKLID